ncbi:MAG: drug/metabolite transporter (DMT)-like permease [Desulforhopalus sp.]|jgi:drug/metabolite transporter (DMT)-like permease
MEDITGELLGVLTVLCWTLSVQFFEFASKRVGAVTVNIVRISVALSLFSLLLYYRQGVLLPTHFPLQSWFLLSLSGIVGFFIGDIFLFRALVELGPRLTMLIQTLAAPMAALIGWWFLDEKYRIFQWLGMLVTLIGVYTVVLEKNGRVGGAQKLTSRPRSRFGVWFALLAMLGQAIGLILSKAGMRVEGGYLDPFEATHVRVFAAFVCFALFSTVTGKVTRVVVALKDRKAIGATAIGATLGPFIGVSLSLWSLHFMTAGVAATLFSLTPVCIIPFGIFLHKEQVSVRAMVGAVVAVAGVYLLTVQY